MVDKHERLAIEALIDEFHRTGSLVNHLPDEVDIVHRVTKVYQDEKRWKQERLARLSSTATKIEITPADDGPVILPFQAPIEQRPKPIVARGSLSRRNPLIDAPSIGPKTAARFEAIAIHTVGQFLDASADEMARRLATYWITSDTVSQWQDQSVLMCEVPHLKSRDAQLLAGAGFGSAMTVVMADPGTIYHRVSDYALTTAGRRYLRGAKAPTRDTVREWLENATLATTSNHRRLA